MANTILLEAVRGIEGSDIDLIIIPFILIFFIIFFTLERINLFGRRTQEGEAEPNSMVDMILAVIITILALRNEQIVQFMNLLLGNFALTFLAIMGLILLWQGIKLFRRQGPDDNPSFINWLLFAAIIGLGLFFMSLYTDSTNLMIDPLENLWSGLVNAISAIWSWVTWIFDSIWGGAQNNVYIIGIIGVFILVIFVARGLNRRGNR